MVSNIMLTLVFSAGVAAVYYLVPRRFRQWLRHTDDRADCNAATNANTLDDHVNSFDLFPCFVVCVCCLLAKGTRAERVLVISAPALRVELPQ